MSAEPASFKRRVLVVDDDPEFGTLAMQVLEGMGIPARFHRGPLGSLHAIRQTNAQVVLLDVEMPSLDGRRVIRMIRETFATGEVAVLLCSNMEARPLELLAGAVRAHGSIPKYLFQTGDSTGIAARLHDGSSRPFALQKTR